MDARGLNKGWRLDYHLVTKEHMDIVVDSSIHKEFKGSDHVPIQLKIDLSKVILISIKITIAKGHKRRAIRESHLSLSFQLINSL